MREELESMYLTSEFGRGKRASPSHPLSKESRAKPRDCKSGRQATLSKKLILCIMVCDLATVKSEFGPCNGDEEQRGAFATQKEAQDNVALLTYEDFASNASAKDLHTSDEPTEHLNKVFNATVSHMFERKRKKKQRIDMIQRQILRMLGMDEQPRINVSLDRISRNDLVRYYKSRMEAERRREEQPTDFYVSSIQSFQPFCPENDEQADGTKPYFLMHFNVSSLIKLHSLLSFKISWANLYLFKTKKKEAADFQGSKAKTMDEESSPDDCIHFTLHEARRSSLVSRERRRPVGYLKLGKDQTGWLKIKLKRVVNRWISSGKIQALELHAEDRHGNKRNSSEFFVLMNCSSKTDGVAFPLPGLASSKFHDSLAFASVPLNRYPTLDVSFVTADFSHLRNRSAEERLQRSLRSSEESEEFRTSNVSRQGLPSDRKVIRKFNGKSCASVPGDVKTPLDAHETQRIRHFY